MPNDARLGLIVGVGLVVVVALVFFRKDLLMRRPSTEPAEARLASSHEPRAGEGPALRRHVVREGETIEELAQRYCKDPGRAADIRRMNALVLRGETTPVPGMTLLIPEGR
jgi:hypothetical protein